MNSSHLKSYEIGEFEYEEDDNNKDGGLGGGVLNKGDDDVFIIISVIFEVWRERERETLIESTTFYVRIDVPHTMYVRKFVCVCLACSTELAVANIRHHLCKF
jgi:hypothetical protein